jgi:hypothetical protein
MAEESPTLTGLAAKISAAAVSIESYLKKNNHPAPSFHPDAPSSMPLVPEVQQARYELLSALSDLELLVQGPFDALTIHMVPVCLLHPYHALPKHSPLQIGHTAKRQLTSGWWSPACSAR